MQTSINDVFEKYDSSHNSGHNYAFRESDCKRMIRDAIVEGRYLKMQEVARKLQASGWQNEQLANLLDVEIEFVETLLK